VVARDQDVPEEAQTDGGRCLIEAAGEHEVGDARLECATRVVVGDGERPAASREDGLQDIGGLDGDVVDSPIADEHEFERARGAIRDNDDEAFAVSVQQFGADEASDGLVVDQPGPRRRRSGAPPDLCDGHEPARRGRPDSWQVLEPREVHRREAGETSCAPEDRTGKREHAPAGLAGAEHQSEHFVVGEGPDADAPHPLAGSVVVGNIR
jgi:hypothetical protein